MRTHNSKPFAVVPCCVYSADAPTRRDAVTGKRIVSMSTPGFIKYLVAKAPDRIGVTTLPFAGKNVVVYSKPMVRADELCVPCT